MEERERQRIETFRNYDAFVAELPHLLAAHSGKFALYHDQSLIRIFDTLALALTYGDQLYGDQVFSVQEITDKPSEVGGGLYASNKEAV
jgi:hypothetical protein